MFNKMNGESCSVCKFSDAKYLQIKTVSSLILFLICENMKNEEIQPVPISSKLPLENIAYHTKLQGHVGKLSSAI